MKKCEFCESTFALEKALHFHQDERHEQLVLVEKPFICPVGHCQKPFRELTFVGLHLQGGGHKSEHLVGIDMTKYPTHLALAIKKNEQSGPGKKSPIEAKPRKATCTDLEGEPETQCTACGKLVQSRFIEGHMKHHAEKLAYPCLKCNKAFKVKKHLTSHNLNTHSVRIFTCPEKSCGKTFKNRKVLHQHIRLLHTNPKRHQCAHCTKSFCMSTDLVCHIKAVHQGIKQFCSVCAKEFLRPSERNRHERNVHSVKRKTTRS